MLQGSEITRFQVPGKLQGDVGDMRNVAMPVNGQTKGGSRWKGFTLLFFSLLLISGIAWLPATAVAQTDPILTYKMTHDLLPADDVFWVEVYEDGAALVHYPIYMKKAGDYVVQLSPNEVQQIRLLLEHPLVKKFDREKLIKEKKEKDGQSAELFAISDNTYSEFEISLEGQTTSGPSTNKQHIRWANVRIDAERYPGMGIFRKLAEIEASLLELDQHPTAQRVE